MILCEDKTCGTCKYGDISKDDIITCDARDKKYRYGQCIECEDYERNN